MKFKKHRVIYNAKNSIIGTLNIGQDNDRIGINYKK
jgi:hypothetical protein